MQPVIKAGHRNRHRGQALFRHRGQDIDVAQDQGRFGDDADRIIEAAQDLEHRAGDLAVAFDGLVGIGVGTQGDDLRPVGGFAQFLIQQSGCRRFGEQAGFEIQPRRQAHVRMTGPGVTIDTAVFAALIGIDRRLKGNVRRPVAGQDGAAGFVGNLRAQGRQVVEKIPAVVDPVAALRLEAPGWVADGAPALGRGIGKRIIHAR